MKEKSFRLGYTLFNKHTNRFVDYDATEYNSYSEIWDKPEDVFDTFLELLYTAYENDTKKRQSLRKRLKDIVIVPVKLAVELHS